MRRKAWLLSNDLRRNRVDEAATVAAFFIMAGVFVSFDFVF